jgi:hypothetical protein
VNVGEGREKGDRDKGDRDKGDHGGDYYDKD